MLGLIVKVIVCVLCPEKKKEKKKEEVKFVLLIIGLQVQ